MKRLALSFFIASQVACASSPPTAAAPTAATPVAAPAPPAEMWLTQLDRDSALIGKVWDVRAKAFVEPAELGKRLASARFVLLGERHDNPDHHRLQARLLQGLVAAGRRPAVVLEMLEVEQQATVEQYLAGPEPTPAGLAAAVRWQETSWPPFAEYQPIFDVALREKLAIAAGNIAHQTARDLVKQGLPALPEERVKALRLDQPLPEPLAADLAEELRASHCGHLPEKLLGPMALAQHARDAQMASVLQRAGVADGAVLIAGAGHARSDRGVPFYLRLAAPEASSLSVSLQEVRHAVVDPEKYETTGFDFLWFTPRGSDEDPCAAFTKPSK